MITVAINNNLESSKYVLELIYNRSFCNGLKLSHIVPSKTVMYHNNKKIPLRTYIEQIKTKKNPDLLIVELTKEAMEKSVYENIKFNIALLFENASYNKKHMMGKDILHNKSLEMIKANYYIVPEAYHKKDHQYITYGWSKEANISASSAELQVDGTLSVQCCIKPSMPTFKGDVNLLREFGIEVPFNDVDATLAAVATLIIYGLQIN